MNNFFLRVRVCSTVSMKELERASVCVNAKRMCARV